MIDDNLIFNTLSKNTCKVYIVKDRHKPNWNCVIASPRKFLLYSKHNITNFVMLRNVK